MTCHDMTEFMDDWNDHTIRRNTSRNTIGGIPVDLYEIPKYHGERIKNLITNFYVFVCINVIYTYTIGYCDQSVRLNAHLWADCMQRNSHDPPDFFPASFGCRAKRILFHKFGMGTGDIKHSNCKNIYLRLCHEMEQYSYCYD